MPPKANLWTHIIYCDYGKPENKQIIRYSFSAKSAKNSWLKMYKSFSQNDWRCWQVNRRGKIIRDTKNASSVH